MMLNWIKINKYLWKVGATGLVLWFLTGAGAVNLPNCWVNPWVKAPFAVGPLKVCNLDPNCCLGLGWKLLVKVATRCLWNWFCCGNCLSLAGLGSVLMNWTAWALNWFLRDVNLWLVGNALNSWAGSEDGSPEIIQQHWISINSIYQSNNFK